MTLFLDNTDDAVKALIMKKNKIQWLPIRNDVREWIFANWTAWEDERPAWFTDAWLRRLDADMVPSAEGGGRGGARGRAGRRRGGTASRRGSRPSPRTRGTRAPTWRGRAAPGSGARGSGGGGGGGQAAEEQAEKGMAAEERREIDRERKLMMRNSLRDLMIDDKEQID
jgi:hypothetical protein